MRDKKGGVIECKRLTFLSTAIALGGYFFGVSPAHAFAPSLSEAATALRWAFVSPVAQTRTGSFDSSARLTLAQAPSAADSSPVAPPQMFSGDVFIRNAIAIAQALSANGAVQAYDAGSAVLKRAATKDDFVKTVAATNARVGQVVSREWVRVERLNVGTPAAGAQVPSVPPGNYVTVVLLARNAQGAAHAEQLSFRLDEDRNWRLSGFTVPGPTAPPS